ncbi:hypothetical protein LZ32DRAFT_51680 [Colletotrichum eremochloae]|nr:hypothetical protein LZ32DRAFT_51680 [Colletotrichum eremochloae]
MPTNQKIFLQGQYGDARSSLFQYSMKSQWINMVSCLLCTQILGFTALSFFFLLGYFVSTKPTHLFFIASIYLFINLPLQVFTAVILGIYMKICKLPRYQIIFRALIFSSFLSWGICSYLGMISYEFVPLPLGLVFFQNLFLHISTFL